MISVTDMADVDLSRETYLKHLNLFLTPETLSKFVCIQPVQKKYSKGELQKTNK